MSARVAFALGLALLAATPARAAVRTLGEIEALGASGTEVRRTEMELERSRNELAQRRAERGFEAYGATTAGWYRNIVDVGNVNSYPGAGVRAGLRRPLLGSAARRDDAIASAENDVRRREAELELATRRARLLLRRSYVSLWEAEAQASLAEALLALEPTAQPLLAARVGPGLLLDSDRLEFLTGFDLARRTRADAKRRSAASLATLERLTGAPLAPLATADEPVPLLRIDAARVESELLLRAPEIAAQDEGVRRLEERARGQRFAGIESSAFVGGGVLPTIDGDVGSTVEAGVEVRFPVSLAEARTGRRGELAADLELARLRRQSLREQLREDWRAALGEYEVAIEDCAFAARRVAAADAALRERSLRAGVAEGDTLEALLRARFAYWAAASDALRAQARAWGASLEVASYEADLEAPLERAGEAAPRFDAARIGAALDAAGRTFARAAGRPVAAAATPPSPAVVARAAAPALGAYLWESDAALGAGRDAVLARLAAAGMTRVLLSLDRAQIDRHAADPAALDAFLAAAHARGLRVELLLGEPSWILPAHRADLVAIVRRLAARAFDGVHLDLEVEQLPDSAGSREARVASWLDTLEWVAAASPWPVSVSVHWRHLAAEAPGPCVPCRLAELRVAEVALMIYVSNAERVAEIARPILAGHPGLRISVAQSVEPALAADESWAARGPAAFEAALAVLRERLAAPNFGGVLIQSWTDYERWSR